MWIAVVLISLALVAILYIYVVGTPGPNPFGIDTREPLKPMVFDRKLKNKVLKQGQLHESELNHFFAVYLVLILLTR